MSDNPAIPEYHTIIADFVFDTVAYLPGLKQMIRFSDESIQLLSLHWHKIKTINRLDLDRFLHDNISVFSTPSAPANEGAMDLFAPRPGNNFARLIGMSLINRFESVEIKPQGVGADRDWLYLSATYTAGRCSITIDEMLAARKARQKLFITGCGIIDLDSKGVTDILDAVESQTADGYIRIKRAALLQLKPDSESLMTVSKDRAATEVFRKIAECKPAEPLLPLRGYTSTLRRYQKLGIQWLLYLYDNGFGGLLCDEMGLGKTHQLIGLMIALREQRGCVQPFLIVCPTTVISHWKNIAATFAKTLKVVIFWGVNRDANSITTDTDIVLTSYGVLRNDSEHLSTRNFALAIFDEAHYLKNPETLSFSAACGINAHFKIVMTGTPVENSIMDIKALFDLVLPGYLGDDGDFQEKFVLPIVSNKVPYVREKLSRLLSPFILRRLKESVLDELPDKIEEIRECILSDEQAALYHEVLASRAREVVKTLQDEEKPIPFIHIFTVLNLLKEICCHPALLLKKPEDFKYHTSGKWDLFVELLGESLSSNQKVVIFTQFLGMVALFEAYLNSINIPHVTLTGSSRNRGKIVDTFNNDASCKIILCSLKTAGVGIDLTAASVVIHYDRWWNAAREDQATDRVHRMGQKNTVLVFKLVTTGTLEDKINALILSKKNLSDSVIRIDSPERLKSFDRRELISLFSEPEKAK
jgi:SNF2 family DNA or RNA helicase